ncbi:hypothetical protein ACFP63_00690 [Oerskovia jenensis]|uniref:Lipoprotein n=1 Tax=Oerskovia jenensis TaxID=162169 RepID=A0ABS2LF69_9CELL|nr:hypothetical protein [Oerskovia jenensis]MBM7479022.1 hypothetical protein [Oerskovia jenensis]
MLHQRNAAIGLGAIAILLIGTACSSAQGAPEIDARAIELLSSLSSIEQDALSDKVVSQDELEHGTRSYIECLESQGFATESTGLASGISGVVVEFEAGSDEEADSKSKLAEDCRAEVDAIDAVWLLQKQPSASELEAAKSGFVSCAHDAGYEEIAPEDSYEQATKVLQEAVKADRTEPDPPLRLELVEQCSLELQTATVTAVPGLSDALEQLEAG